MMSRREYTLLLGLCLGLPVVLIWWLFARSSSLVNESLELVALLSNVATTGWLCGFACRQQKSVVLSRVFAVVLASCAILTVQFLVVKSGLASETIAKALLYLSHLSAALIVISLFVALGAGLAPVLRRHGWIAVISAGVMIATGYVISVDRVWHVFYQALFTFYLPPDNWYEPYAVLMLLAMMLAGFLFVLWSGLRLVGESRRWPFVIPLALAINGGFGWVSLFALYFR
ncbi:hypothetical protein [Thaumasiovibrio subtropicus]|uniref:hypothetical protein n=1 Tax=Thaumasiovibrio subtropicus TaxID=1891207 RepID=UPI000B34CA59|nr:hypothetical protein [Thaumasiovibrio subtropicus]